jgi:hypothetical protein
MLLLTGYATNHFGSTTLPDTAGLPRLLGSGELDRDRLLSLPTRADRSRFFLPAAAVTAGLTSNPTVAANGVLMTGAGVGVAMVGTGSMEMGGTFVLRTMSKAGLVRLILATDGALVTSLLPLLKKMLKLLLKTTVPTHTVQ